MQILNMQNINIMGVEFQLSEQDVKLLEKEKPATVPRKKGNFRMLRELNGKVITHLDLFNTLYYECFPEENIIRKHDLKEKCKC